MNDNLTAPKPEIAKHRLSKDGKWRSFPKAPGLLQYVSTGKYFARVRVHGKLFRQSLETTVFTTAKEKLPDFVKEHRTKKHPEGTFGEALAKYEWEIENDASLSPHTKRYRKACIAKMLDSWPGLKEQRLKNLDRKECVAQFGALFEAIDAQYYNNILGTFRAILRQGGVQPEDDPTRGEKPIKRKGVVIRSEELEADVLDKLVDYLAKSSSWRHQKAALVVRFLAFSGCRISEARQMDWQDVGEHFLTVRNAKTRNYQNHEEFRKVVIIPPMRALLAELREGRDNPRGRVLPFSECYGSMKKACADLHLPPLTHHTFRAWFATRAIESGIDIPTVAQWLGHRDGGALLLKRYRKASEAHSLKMAEKFAAGGKAAQ